MDPDCSGPFGTCTQADKTKLGYAAIKKLHEKMDEDKDGEVEIHETKEFIKDDLAFKNGGRSSSDRQKKLHSKDDLITVDELWNAWEYSQEYNWTTTEVIQWLEEVVKLPEYSENFRRNLIDGQFLPRLVSNENHYYSNVMQIKDPRHKRLMIVKATDLVLFGAQQRPHNIVKDIIMIGALTLSIFGCIYLYSKHRKSLEQIETMLVEFDKLSNDEHGDRKFSSTPINGVDFDLFSAYKKRNSSLNFEGTLIDKSDVLKKSRENSIEETETKSAQQNQEDDRSVYQLKLAEQELERLKALLKKSESRMDLIKYQPPSTLISLLNKTYESEKSLLDYKLSVIEKDKTECVDSLNKVCRRQAGFLGALKIAHSSTLEDIQHKLEGLKIKHQKLKSEQHESTKRWNSIFQLCVSQQENTPNLPARSNSHAIASSDSSSGKSIR